MPASCRKRYRITHSNNKAKKRASKDQVVAENIEKKNILTACGGKSAEDKLQEEGGNASKQVPLSALWGRGLEAGG